MKSAPMTTADRTTLPQSVKELLDASTYVVLSTSRRDGTPQSSVVWAGRDGDDVVMATRADNAKAFNLLRDPRANICFYDPTGPVNQYTIYGSVTVSEDGADELAASLSAKYVPSRPDPVRYLGETSNHTKPWLVLRLTPERIHEHH